ncbi:MAG: hypothetical protein ACI9WU_004578, partial [Myxococcota bacterium]
DCNFHGDPYPVCNQIDGGSLDLDGKPLVDATACQGMLGPPGLKCVAGDCMTPGTLPSGAECFHGSQCPINSGCIPDDFQNYETATCKTFCQDSPCPSGTWCAWETWTSQGETYQQADCVDAYGCRAGMAQCADQISDCTRNLDCAFARCVHRSTLPTGRHPRTVRRRPGRLGQSACTYRRGRCAHRTAVG